MYSITLTAEEAAKKQLISELGIKVRSNTPHRDTELIANC